MRNRGGEGERDGEEIHNGRARERERERELERWKERKIR